MPHLPRFFVPLNGLASIADRRAKQLKSLMFKTVNHLVPEYLSDKFANVNKFNTIHNTKFNTIHRHKLRGVQHNLFIPTTEYRGPQEKFLL